MFRLSEPLFQNSDSEEPRMFLAAKQHILVVCTMKRKEQSHVVEK